MLLSLTGCDETKKQKEIQAPLNSIILNPYSKLKHLRQILSMAEE